MPLKKNSVKRKSLDSESGYETLDSVNSETNIHSAKKEKDNGNEEELEDDKNAEEEDDVSNDKWLESMGIEAAEIRKLNNVQVRYFILMMLLLSSIFNISFL